MDVLMPCLAFCGNEDNNNNEEKKNYEKTMMKPKWISAMCWKPSGADWSRSL